MTGHPDVERFPIGYRFVDYDGDVRVVVGYGTGGYEYDTVYRTEDGKWEHMPTNHDLLRQFKPYVEPEPKPEFTHYGWVHPRTRTVKSGYDAVFREAGLDEWFAYGIRDGELFIEWVTA